MDDRADALRPPAALHARRAATRIRRAGNCEGGVHFDIFDDPPVHDRRADPRRRSQRRRAGRSRQAADAADGGRPRRQDQGAVPAHAALDHRVLLGLEPARPRRPADEDRDALDGRSALSVHGGRGSATSSGTASGTTRPTPAGPSAKRSSRASTSEARRSRRTSRRKCSTPSASPSSPIRARRGSPSGAARRAAARAVVRSSFGRGPLAQGPSSRRPTRTGSSAAWSHSALRAQQARAGARRLPGRSGGPLLHAPRPGLPPTPVRLVLRLRTTT